jgi:hypothetical protein
MFWWCYRQGYLVFRDHVWNKISTSKIEILDPLSFNSFVNYKGFDYASLLSPGQPLYSSSRDVHAQIDLLDPLRLDSLVKYQCFLRCVSKSKFSIRYVLNP